MQVVAIDHLLILLRANLGAGSLAQTIDLVLATLIWLFGQNRLQVQDIFELKLLIVFGHCLNLRIVVVSIERYLKNGWQLNKSDKFSSVLFPISRCVVLIVSIQALRCNVLSDAIFYGIIAADAQINGTE